MVQSPEPVIIISKDTRKSVHSVSWSSVFFPNMPSDVYCFVYVT